MTAAQAPSGSESRGGDDNNDIPRWRRQRRRWRTHQRTMTTRNAWYRPPWRATRTTTSSTDATAPPGSDICGGGDDNDIPRRRRTRRRTTATRNEWHRPPRRVTRTTTSSKEATTRATVLKTMTISSSVHNGDSEHMASLGGDGATTVPEGLVYGRTTADKNQIRWGRRGSQ